MVNVVVSAHFVGVVVDVFIRAVAGEEGRRKGEGVSSGVDISKSSVVTFMPSEIPSIRKEKSRIGT